MCPYPGNERAHHQTVMGREGAECTQYALTGLHGSGVVIPGLRRSRGSRLRPGLFPFAPFGASEWQPGSPIRTLRLGASEQATWIACSHPAPRGFGAGHLDRLFAPCASALRSRPPGSPVRTVRLGASEPATYIADTHPAPCPCLGLIVSVHRLATTSERRRRVSRRGSTVRQAHRALSLSKGRGDRRAGREET